ncbi:hypothetical protein BASA50_000290 [Batrachochytrium salamandrivorans]|uniref:Uncharacterized protein n=1 Tax=Batrachochytrium salamandrivorans TaxID=1357716 RepID=A0ABQ8EUS1_9FUNG|nr:hypothetical protein BASA50_000290 [Batrachochytrium salamandrivorans]KAH9251718.1 hypothetical protein BASA81_010388 [Batrachochytrium salamandrivorans]KAH9274602.1 hypothetical protein BASA83_002786 [Batrachochytrium salamandrivorans]
MKFNALVAAAMVITSVNAAGEGGLMSCFGLGCGSGSRVTQGRQVNGQESGMTQSSPERGWGPGSSGSSRKSLGHRLRSVFLSKSSRHGLGKSQDPDTTKESEGNGSSTLEANELICYGVVSALKYLHEQMATIADDSNNQQLVSPGLNDKTNSLKKSYDKNREEFVKHGCLTKYPDLLSQKQLAELDMLFN